MVHIGDELHFAQGGQELLVAVQSTQEQGCSGGRHLICCNCVAMQTPAGNKNMRTKMQRSGGLNEAKKNTATPRIGSEWHVR